MDGNTSTDPDPESLQTRVFHLPGEPAIVINGVPDLPVSVGSGDIVDSTRVGDSESCRNATPSPELFGVTGYGEWFEGRRVRKPFGFEYYLGTVTQFDKESGWFRVVYEDGDFEDLDWRELQEVILPLDITVPLKSLAQKIIKKNQRSNHKSGKSVARSQTVKARSSKER
ncbi:hypothetical protein K2173_019418 [Erythroxylum novogranatense]|uniref:PTM/DIR17-like Tudor domain-containing protein n=1 Tax=Erythroxylum novogranatense TaxID=1862640 RepID=A0AAV8UB71_9ROSI|nr:hypothetical protein K2173_019418 [Erythroxylum novogranatense]